jgi:tRNA dimethylallyltransferase
MDIGTGKDLSEYGDVPAHLLDIVDAGTKYNIFEYQKDFSKAYTNILERGCFPIICGGSGLYIEAATRGYELYEVLPDEDLRARLEPKPMEELVQMLKDLKATKGVKPHNDTDWDTKKRVIRAIEIEMAQTDPRAPLPLPQNVLFVGVSVDRDTRNARIDARLEARLQEGMVEEVKRLLDSGIPAEDLIYYGLEYKFLTQYLIGELSYEEMVSGLRTAIHQFAKRQMTWFRGMERKGVEIHWVER